MTTTTTPSTDDEAARIVDLVRDILHSPAYALRLRAIHAHYHNSKSEGRYRDALLEAFNDSAEARAQDLRAYAEADKVDMVVTRPGLGRDRWVRIEFKYQFTFDLACRVRATLDKLTDVSSEQSLRLQLEAMPSNDLKRIVHDCLGRTPDDKSPLCDVFVLIIQDRSGATHPDATRSHASHKHARPWVCPTLDTRGVRLQFLHEQLSLDARYTDDRAGYDAAWMNATLDLLRLVYAIRPFDLQLAARTMADPFPMTSWILTLDFKRTSPFPEDVDARMAAARAAAEPGLECASVHRPSRARLEAQPATRRPQKL